MPPLTTLVVQAFFGSILKLFLFSFALLTQAAAFFDLTGNVALFLDGVSGGKETNPLLASKVSNEAFEQALTDSLINFGLYNSTNGRYQLEAELLALEQPMMGFSFTVNSVIEYKVHKDNSSVFEKTIKASGTATTGDTIIGVERLKIANERAIKNNIRMFIDEVLTR